MISVSIRKSRLSHAIISRTGEFTLNLVSRALCESMDFCGVKSGRDVDKFAARNLTPIPAPEMEHAPAAAEAPAFLSCKVQQVIELGSHDLFLAEVRQVSIQDRYFRPDGSINEEAMDLVGYVHGKYRALGEVLGFFGLAPLTGIDSSDTALMSVIIVAMWKALGYNVMLCNSQDDEKQLSELFDFLLGHQADGIMLLSADDRTCDYAAKYLGSVPLVLLMDSVPESYLDRCSAVSLDNDAAGRMAIEHLHRLGQRHFPHPDHRRWL